jgi:hypothetical protein
MVHVSTTLGAAAQNAKVDDRYGEHDSATRDSLIAPVKIDRQGSSGAQFSGRAYSIYSTAKKTDDAIYPKRTYDIDALGRPETKINNRQIDDILANTPESVRSIVFEHEIDQAR